MENSAKEPLQSNAITGVNDNLSTSVVSNRIIVKAMVHNNANGEKEAAIISSTPIEKSIHNCETYIAARCEPNDLSPDKCDIYLLNKSESSTPEVSTSYSDHYDWPEINVEDTKREKIRIIRNIALKSKSPKNCITQPQKRMRLDDEIFPPFDEIILSPPKEFQDAECSVHVKDVGFSLIKQILDLIDNNQFDTLTKIETFVAALK
ncbi:uncharacterized protein LOC125503417 isoform X1 [Dendroctonus ponderosae]|uniref:Uncharacterized protein n=1 Tax=Dendroctonus ponderosae TaxID=77166 RepID=U4US87_DENPD|nr:uncharacterized protein LOC125503417 isoform X1 [Dendroctonus ponderosae]ERL95977.1 hypothetical protein D910_00728 [Dendroctonus ponderosae]